MLLSLKLWKGIYCIVFLCSLLMPTIFYVPRQSNPSTSYMKSLVTRNTRTTVGTFSKPSISTARWMVVVTSVLMTSETPITQGVGKGVIRWRVSSWERLSNIYICYLVMFQLSHWISLFLIRKPTLSQSSENNNNIDSW